MFYPNDPATNYRYRGSTDATKLRIGTQALVVTSNLLIRFGNEYAADRGIAVTTTLRGDAGDSNFYTDIRLHTPWDTDYTVTHSGWVTDDDWELYIDDAELTTNCHSWEFTFSELRFYNEGVLVKTIPGNSVSGLAYDRRMTTVKATLTQLINNSLFFFQLPGCDAVASDTYLNPTSFNFGWQLDSGGWTSKDVTCNFSQAVPYPIVPPGCPECTCQRGLPDIDVDPVSQSWDITLIGAANRLV